MNELRFDRCLTFLPPSDGRGVTMIKTPPSASLRVRRKNGRQIRKHFGLSRANGQDSEGTLWKMQSGQRDARFTKMPATVIQWQEITAYLRLFGEWTPWTQSSGLACKFAFIVKGSRYGFVSDDDLIQQFLRMDCCYKMTDKVKKDFL